MGSYTMIADAGSAIVRLLRREMVPLIIPNEDAIGLASPAQRGDLSLCVHLYDISESEDFRISGMISEGVDRQRFPPIFLTLSYLITAFSASDVKFRSEEEQRILGKVVQTLRDYPVLNPRTLEFSSSGSPDGIHMALWRLESEQKQKIWNFSSLEPKLSLFYKLGPVPLESSRTKEIQRVHSVEFGSGRKEEGIWNT